MKLVKNYKETSLMIAFLNIFFIFMIVILQSSLHSGGTGDVNEGDMLISLYLHLKSILIIVTGILLLFYGLIKKKVSIISLVCLCYGILLLSSVSIFGRPINPPADPREWGYDTIKGNIILMNADCLVILIFSVAISILSFLKKARESIISLSLNLLLILFYAYLSFFKLLW